MLFVGASNEFDEFRASALANITGTAPAILLSGLGSLAVMWFSASLSYNRSSH